MTTDQRMQVWNSLRDKEYREHFAGNVGVGLAFQIRLLREKHGWTQEELAQRAGKRQEMISQWENPNYGRFTLNTLKDLAVSFDVALVVRFAPFSELVDWEMNLTPERLAPLSYEEERQQSTATVPISRDAADEYGWAMPYTGYVSLSSGTMLPQAAFVVGITVETVIPAWVEQNVAYGSPEVKAPDYLSNEVSEPRRKAALATAA